MSVKLSSFLNTSFATSAIDSIAVIGIIETAEATMPLDSGTSGNYLKNLLTLIVHLVLLAVRFMRQHRRLVLTRPLLLR
jgi:hypothetical protein